MNEEDLKNSFIKELMTRPEEFRTTSSFTYNLYNATNLLLLKVKQTFDRLVNTKLDDNSSVTLQTNNVGFFSVTYKDEEFGKVVRFNTLEDALKVLDIIEKCDSISELVDCLDV